MKFFAALFVIAMSFGTNGYAAPNDGLTVTLHPGQINVSHSYDAVSGMITINFGTSSTATVQTLSGNTYTGSTTANVFNLTFEFANTPGVQSTVQQIFLNNELLECTRLAAAAYTSTTQTPDTRKFILSIQTYPNLYANVLPTPGTLTALMILAKPDFYPIRSVSCGIYP